jgi:transcription elongation factor/antiterminator RfaH
MSISSTQWYVVHTQPRGEIRAEQNLRLQGYKVFAPQFWRKIRHARQIKTFPCALFPRYIFVELNLSRDRWRSINGTVGVSSLVTSVDRPLPLPDGLVEALMSAQACGFDRSLDDAFQVNDRARFDSGHFAEMIGRIQSIDEKGRVQVLLEIMGRTVPVQTTVSQLRSLTA